MWVCGISTLFCDKVCVLLHPGTRSGMMYTIQDTRSSALHRPWNFLPVTVERPSRYRIGIAVDYLFEKMLSFRTRVIDYFPLLQVYMHMWGCNATVRRLVWRRYVAVRGVAPCLGVVRGIGGVERGGQWCACCSVHGHMQLGCASSRRR
jgi:hypothetical protein